MLSIIKPPQPIEIPPGVPSVFLAGSIEMGAAEDWQEQFAQRLQGQRLVVLNPRREAWDSSWEQSIDNPLFREQVEWELAGLERADWIVVYFAPQARAPITLLELGLHARGGKLLVCCPTGYWRKGTSMWSAPGMGFRRHRR